MHRPRKIHFEIIWCFSPYWLRKPLIHFCPFLTAQFIPPDLTPDLYDIINVEDLEQDDIDWHKWLFGLNAEKGEVKLFHYYGYLTKAMEYCLNSFRTYVLNTPVETTCKYSLPNFLSENENYIFRQQ